MVGAHFGVSRETFGIALPPDSFGVKWCCILLLGVAQCYLVLRGIVTAFFGVPFIAFSMGLKK
jgi:hypothetical protein